MSQVPRPRPRVALTVSVGSLRGLADQLEKAGLEVRHTPLLSFEPPRDWTRVDLAIAQLDQYPTLVFTSPRAAAAFGARYRRVIGTAPPPAPPSIWATGEPTAAAAYALFTGSVIETPNIAARPSSGGAADALATAMIAAAVCPPVLFPCGDPHRSVLPRRLARHGLTVEEAVCYRAVLAPLPMARGVVVENDIVVAGSPRIAALLQRAAPDRCARPALVALGVTTARAAARAGWIPATIARAATAEGVARAVLECLHSVRSGGATRE